MRILPSSRCFRADARDSYYKSLTFYLQEQPTLLTDLLTVLIPRIDHTRVVKMFRQIDHIPLIRSYLIAVQHVRPMLVYHVR